MEFVTCNKPTVVMNLAYDPIGDSICLPTGHGHYAYVSTDCPQLIHDLLRSMSIWNGKTGCWAVRTVSDGTRFYDEYELSGKDKPFFICGAFQRICARNDVRLCISTESDMTHIRNFFYEARRVV